MPGATYFKPRGIPMRVLEEVRLSVDELESLRLKDLMGLEQEVAAREMGVSRPTFQRILEDAHRKVTEALVAGKALEIEGGDYEVVPMTFHCRRCGHTWEQRLTGGVSVACPNCEEKHEEFPAYLVARQQRDCPVPIQPSWPQADTPVPDWDQEKRMKIAVISDDGNTISMHFGMARYYVVFSVEDGKIVSREVRSKVGHHTFGDHPHEEHHGAAPHGYDAASQDKHSQMAGNIRDCKVLLAGGMGWGAHDSLKGYGIEPIITDIRDAEQAISAYMNGTLRNLSERLH